MRSNMHCWLVTVYVQESQLFSLFFSTLFMSSKLSCKQLSMVICNAGQSPSKDPQESLRIFIMVLSRILIKILKDPG